MSTSSGETCEMSISQAIGREIFAVMSGPHVVMLDFGRPVGGCCVYVEVARCTNVVG